MAGKPRVQRGVKKPSNSEGAIASRLSAAAEAASLIEARSPAQIADHIQRTQPERWVEISNEMTEGAYYGAQIVNRALREMWSSGETKPQPGLKDVATIAAIFVDKGAVINQTLATLGQTRNADVTDLEKRIAMLLAAQTELQARAREAQPIDVTPQQAGGATIHQRPPRGD